MAMLRFIAGAIVAEKTRGVRSTDQIQAAQHGLGRITSTLQCGHDAIRPSRHCDRVRPITR
jgi:hypothetical protein